MSVMVVVVLAVVTYRHIREHGIEPHVRPPNSARVVKIGTCMLIAAALVWTGIYLRAQEHYGAGMIAALCGAGVAVYGIRNR